MIRFKSISTRAHPISAHLACVVDTLCPHVKGQDRRHRRGRMWYQKNAWWWHQQDGVCSGKCTATNIFVIVFEYMHQISKCLCLASVVCQDDAWIERAKKRHWLSLAKARTQPSFPSKFRAFCSSPGRVLRALTLSSLSSASLSP